MKTLNPQLKAFDLRFLALEKLSKAKGNNSFLTYREARCVLGRTLHLTKKQSRTLFLQMASDGMIRWDCKGRIFLLDKEH